MVGISVQAAQQRRAHGTWPRAFGAVHPVVNEKRVFIAEQSVDPSWIGALHAACLAQKLIVTGYLASGRQGATLRGDAGDVPAQIDLLDQKRRACLAILGTFIRLTGFAFSDQL